MISDEELQVMEMDIEKYGEGFVGTHAFRLLDEYRKIKKHLNRISRSVKELFPEPDNVLGD